MTTRRMIDGDYAFGGGTANIIGGREEIHQRCVTTLSHLKGEWFLDMNSGVDWGTIIGHRPSTPKISRIITNALKDVEGVTSSRLLHAEYGSDRSVNVIVQVHTPYGDIDISQTHNVLEELANDTNNQ